MTGFSTEWSFRHQNESSCVIFQLVGRWRPPPPFFNSIRTSRVMMIMMMVTMIITVTIFTPIFAGSESVSRVKCQVQSRALAADPCRFVFPPRHLGEAASIRPSDRSQGTAAISGSQYNASPVPSEPTMQNANRKPEHLPPRMAPREERRGGEGGETEKQTIITSRIACLSSLRAAWEDFSFQIVKWRRINERIYKERSGILPLSSTSKHTFLSRSGGGRGGGGEKIARQTRLSVPSLSPNITDLMKSNYSRVSEGKTVTETSFITEKQEPVIEEYGYH